MCSYCPTCDAPIEPQSADAIGARILKDYRGRRITLLAPLVVARKGLYTALAKWARGKGYAALRVDGTLLPTTKWPRARSIHRAQHRTARGDPDGERRSRGRTARGTGIGVAAWARRRAHRRRGTAAVFSTKRACPNCGTGYPELDPRLFSFNSRHGWCGSCFGTGLQLAEFDAEQSGEESNWRESAGAPPVTCPDCAGERLNPVARRVLFRGLSIAALTNLPVQEFRAALLNFKLLGRERSIARDLVAELSARTAFLCDVGLGYLQLSRAAPTLSGGEAQRIRLAAQLGSNLQGVCYVLDEPTIGLHPRDNAALLETLNRLRAKGNTLVVVEHDEDTIRRADHVIDLGPGAGHARRPLGRARYRGGTRVTRKFRHRALSRDAAAAFPLPPPCNRPQYTRNTNRRRGPAQPAQGGCENSARPPDRDHRGIRFRQIFGGARCPVGQLAAPAGAPPPARVAGGSKKSSRRAAIQSTAGRP